MWTGCSRLVGSDRTVQVPDVRVAAATLAQLGMTHDLIDDRIAMGTTGRCRLAG